MKRLLIIVFLIFVLNGCGSNKNGSNVSGNQGYLYLQFSENQSFNPDIDHGQIDKFKVSITGDSLANPIVNYFPYDTEKAEFDGFEDGSSINVMVEAINYNEYVVRRGYSEEIQIQAGTDNPATVSINNVPIFANVKSGGTVKLNRFVPKIFAPGEIQFEIIDTFNGEDEKLEDQVSGDVSFSINSSDEDSVKPVYISFLSTGTHQLKVRDIDTGETTTITINAEEASDLPALATTAGGYVGSMMSTDIFVPSNMPYYFDLMME